MNKDQLVLQISAIIEDSQAQSDAKIIRDTLNKFLKDLPISINATINEKELAQNIKDIKAQTEKLTKELSGVANEVKNVTASFDEKDRAANVVDTIIESTKRAREGIQRFGEDLDRLNAPAAAVKDTSAEFKKLGQVVKKIEPLGEKFSSADLGKVVRDIEGLNRAKLEFKKTLNLNGQEWHQVIARTKDASGVYQQMLVSVNKAVAIRVA